MMDLEDILTELFYTWRPYEVLIAILRERHGINRSVRWLKQQYQRLGLFRRCPDSPEHYILQSIRCELMTSNCLLGYRAMWHVLRFKYGIRARRDTVMKLLKDEDPDGNNCRRKHALKRRIYRSKGPNHIWHLDGYDKLSPYGLTIHGCIDGFSRKILWLKIAHSNSNPKYICRYYLEKLEELCVCPAILRADYGTENSRIASVHIAFRYNHNDEFAREKSFIYAGSKHNVRIEGWWSQLRRRKTSWWINLFKTLEDDGLLDRENAFQRDCLVYSSLLPITQELEEFVVYWNSHLIRKNKMAQSPSGVPNEMYGMPSLYGACDQAKPFDLKVWLEAMQNESAAPLPLLHEEFIDWADDVLSHDLNMTRNDIHASQVQDVYLYLAQQPPPFFLYDGHTHTA